MLFIPLSLMLGAPFGTGVYVRPLPTLNSLALTPSQQIWKSLIPSVLGNIVGALFMAVPMSYFYLFDGAALPGSGASQDSGIGFGSVSVFGRKEEATVQVREAESGTSTL